MKKRKKICRWNEITGMSDNDDENIESSVKKESVIKKIKESIPTNAPKTTTKVQPMLLERD